MEPKIFLVSWSLHKTKNKINPQPLRTHCCNQKRIYFIIDTIKEVVAHKSRSLLTLMKNIEVNNNWKIDMGSLRLIGTFGISSAKYSQTGSQQLVNLCSIGKLDKCGTSISCTNYKWNSNLIHWINTCLSPRRFWCICIHGYDFRNGELIKTEDNYT